MTTPQDYSTTRLGHAAGYSVQQVRDLEALGVIPPAARRPNGYRRFGPEHLLALRAYRRLAAAVGPVEARAALRDARSMPYEDAIARITALHLRLARARDDTVTALQALDDIVAERAGTEAEPTDAMSITELAEALGVRSSTLRFWEKERMLNPERVPGLNVRRYPVPAIRQARIIAALRAGGYGIPAIRTVLESLRDRPDVEDIRELLQRRLRTIADQSAGLLRAGTDIADLLDQT